jgi:hypothetical protein
MVRERKRLRDREREKVEEREREREREGERERESDWEIVREKVNVSISDCQVEHVFNRHLSLRRFLAQPLESRDLKVLYNLHCKAYNTSNIAEEVEGEDDDDEEMMTMEREKERERDEYEILAAMDMCLPITGTCISLIYEIARRLSLSLCQPSSSFSLSSSSSSSFSLSSSCISLSPSLASFARALADHLVIYIFYEDVDDPISLSLSSLPTPLSIAHSAKETLSLYLQSRDILYKTPNSLYDPSLPIYRCLYKILPFPVATEMVQYGVEGESVEGEREKEREKEKEREREKGGERQVIRRGIVQTSNLGWKTVEIALTDAVLRREREAYLSQFYPSLVQALLVSFQEKERGSRQRGRGREREREKRLFLPFIDFGKTSLSLSTSSAITTEGGERETEREKERERESHKKMKTSLTTSATVAGLSLSSSSSLSISQWNAFELLESQSLSLLLNTLPRVELGDAVNYRSVYYPSLSPSRSLPQFVSEWLTQTVREKLFGPERERERGGRESEVLMIEGEKLERTQLSLSHYSQGPAAVCTENMTLLPSDSVLSGTQQSSASSAASVSSSSLGKRERERERESDRGEKGRDSVGVVISPSLPLSLCRVQANAAVKEVVGADVTVDSLYRHEQFSM